MKILVVGTGFVGLPHAAVCAEYGHEVVAFDIDEKRIQAYRTGQRAQIERYVNEPGLAEVVAQELGKHLTFSTELESAAQEADVIFMCLNTPPQMDGSTDLSYFETAAHNVGKALQGRKNARRVLVVNKSTVPIGTARLMQSILTSHAVKNFGVASNPEFLAQGNAVEGSRRPDRIVVGADGDEDYQILRGVYSQFINHVRITYVETTPETAEAIKYVANSLLLTYISYWNGVGARLAETFDNIRMEDLRKGVTSDNRISTWGAYVGNGAGGSCLGKDIRSLIHQMNEAGQNSDMLEAVYHINEHQKLYMVERAVEEAEFNFEGKTITLLGLAFKKRTNDMRDSPSIKAVDALLDKGVASIRAYDPLAMEASQTFWLSPKRDAKYEKVSYWPSIQDALEESDAVYISTDWEEFRGLSAILPECTQAPYLVIDARRMIFDYGALTEKGYTYLPVGGPVRLPQA